VHLPLKFKGCDLDDLWRGYAAGEKYRAQIKNLLDLCARGGVGKVIMHVAHKIPAPNPSAEGLRSFRELEAYAKARAIKICYENCKHSVHLAAVMEGADPFHGFCYDSGHHYCYTPKEDLLGQYGDRLLYTHLHDNLGNWEDLHLLPGDGTLDWSKLLPRLKGAEEFNLELSCTYRAPYRAMKFEEFATLAYERAEKLGGN
jgi:sugar phosphate isomerase/epimerase